MPDHVPTIDEIDSEKKLEAYLKTRSTDEARIVAFRIAVRIYILSMPDIQAASLSPRQIKHRYISVFHAFLLCFFYFQYPNLISHKIYSHLAQRLKNIDGPSPQASIRAASRLVDALINDENPAFFTGRLSNIFLDYKFCKNIDHWDVIRSDVGHVRGRTFSSIDSVPLWGVIDYDIYRKRIDLSEEIFNGIGGRWIFILQWLLSLQTGWAHQVDEDHAVKEQLAYDIALLEFSGVDDEPDKIMTSIADIFERSFNVEGLAKPNPVTADSVNADFFISYSTLNEAEAREINGYLEDAGYSTIVQFKDFPVGSNFVIEMQKGLQAERFMGLLSPGYFASKQCQAEWNAAYNRDPSGEQRYLVPILIEKTELSPLAKQIVYKSIVGLSGDARRNAVLEAIGKLKRSEVPGIRSPYEFELTSTQTITAVAGAMNSVSVLPGRDPGDARKRLEAARDIANDLITGLMDNRFQVGRHYIKELENYRDRLPLDATESVYSADAALRNLRDDLENDIRYGICDRFAPRLQRLIEAHYGLRVYFPELLEFYDDVKQARQAEPPPLEALGQLRQVVKTHTPDLFEPSVDAAFGHAVDVARPATEEQEAPSVSIASSSATSTLPPDPIAGVDPVRAAQHAQMSMQNRIWAVLRRIEDGGKTVERVDKAVASYARWIDPILDWLSKST